MSLGNKIVQAVQLQTAKNSPLPLHASVHEANGGSRVEATVGIADHDRLSLMADEVRVQVFRPAGNKAKEGGAAKLAQARAEKLASRATYLTETLQFVECEVDGAAIVRSTPKTMRGPRSPYFEAKIGEDAISLRRYQANSDRPGRHRVNFYLNEDVLARLVDDAYAILT